VEKRENTMEDAWKKFEDILHKAIEKHVPVIAAKKSKVAPRHWMMKATSRSMSRRNVAWKKYRELKTEANYTKYKRLRNETNRKVKEDHLAYRKKILESFKGNPHKVLWIYDYTRLMALFPGLPG